MPFFGDMPLDSIDRESLEKFVAHMFDKTVGKVKGARTSRNGKLEKPRAVGAKTVKNVMSTLHTIMRSALEQLGATVEWLR